MNNDQQSKSNIRPLLDDGDILRELVLQFDTPLWLCDLDGTVQLKSHKSKKYSGNRADENKDKPLSDIISISNDELLGIIRRVVETNQTEKHQLEQTPSDGIRHILWSFSPLRIENRPSLVKITATDLTDFKQTEKQLTTRLAYENCLSRCSQVLLTGKADFRDVLNQTLQFIQAATDICRVYIFENFEDPKDGLVSRQISEACARGIQPEIDNPLLQHVPFNIGMYRWKNVLSKGEIINGLVDAFPAEERELLTPQGILSILAIPIMSEDGWYGFIGFDDTKNHREWNHNDIQLLGSISEMIGAFIDRGRKEKTLEAERSQLLSIFDAIDEPIYVADPDSYELLYMNKACTKSIGHCIGQKCYNALQKLDAPCPFCTNEYIFGENLGKSYIWEFKNQVTNRWVHCIDKAIQWPDRKMVRYEMAIDITRRKRNEEAITQQKERQANIIEATSIGTWEWNVQTGETIFNEQWAAIIGFTLEELSPVSIDTWINCVHPEDVKTSDALLKKHFTKELDYYQCECRMKHKDGSWVWVSDRGKVISWSDDGKPLRMFGIHTDITSRKQTEAERDRVIDELQEALNQIRTLSGLLPICAKCKKIRDDKGYWNNLESFIEKHSEAQFSHGLCENCATELYGDQKWFKKKFTE